MNPDRDQRPEPVEPGQTGRTDMRNHRTFRRLHGSVSRLAALRPSLAMGLLTVLLGWIVLGTESRAQTITTVAGGGDGGPATNAQSSFPPLVRGPCPCWLWP